MKVVGITSQQEVYLGSKDRNFRINEYLIIEDKFQGDQIGEVVEAQTFNKYIPLSTSSDFVDSSVIESLKALGYSIDDETIYIAKIRLLVEALYPIETGSSVREPSFSEIRKLMIRSNLEDSLLMGVIKNTDPMYEDMEEELKGLVKTFEESGLEEQKDIPYLFDLKSMHHYPHIGIFGGSGSGKSFGIRVMLEELMEQRFPTLVLDPHYEMDFSSKPEYDIEGGDFEDKYISLQVGLDTGVEFTKLRGGDLKNLLSAISNLSEGMENSVDILLKNNDSYISFKNRLERLLKGQEQGSKGLERKIEETSGIENKEWLDIKETYEKYSNSVPQASAKGIMWRLVALDREGIFNKNIDPIIENLQQGKLVVIQGSANILQVFSTYLISNIYRKRRSYKDAQYKNEAEEFFPPFMVVTDEAHNFAPKGYDSPAKSILKEISQEGRKYGVFLVLASQRPTLLDDTITAQLNTKFIFRTVRASDIDTIKEETDISPEDARRLPYLRTGDVFISSSSLGRTAFARIRAAKSASPHRENPLDELRNKGREESKKFFREIKEQLPLMESQLLQILPILEKTSGESKSLDQLELRLDDLVARGLIEVENTPFGKRYTEKN